ncbi:MAG: hypothetical protein IAE95_06235 [Chitinophagaceae bacterium]|nr:hypothetical protein [Chitinophagaceae bacterium]
MSIITRFMNPQPLRIICTLLVAALTLTGCGDGGDSLPMAYENYVPVSSTDCPNTKLNGKWKLIYSVNDGRSTPATEDRVLTFVNCALASYTVNGEHEHTDIFKAAKVTQYCADFQLTFHEDSIACVNFHKDTLVIGGCSNMETQYYYKKIQ